MYVGNVVVVAVVVLHMMSPMLWQAVVQASVGARRSPKRTNLSCWQQ